MSKPAWHRVKEILEGALEQSPADRSAFVARSCDDDRALREEVESLLTSIEQSGDFIERPAFESLRDSVASGIGAVSNANERVLEPDDSLGPYTILEFVGAGGMGQVYRAHDTELNRDVALKVRSNASAWDNDRFTHFRREAQILAALNHPNIAAIYGIESSDAMQALVLEFVEGPTLASRIRNGRIPVSEVLLFAKQIAEGLEAAHKRGIIHRDLKPANIKLCPNGTAKILDFGLAKALDAVDAALPPERGAEESSGISHAGLVFGTAAYMSPEQARGEAVDKRTDIWAFGCVVYESLTGVPAFAGDTIPETIKAVLETAPNWSLLPGETPPFVVKLLRKCLEKNANRRLHDIADARIEIEDAEVPVAMSLPPRPRSRTGLVLVAVLAAAIGGTVWTLSQRTNSVSKVTPAVKRLQLPLPNSVRETGGSIPTDLAQLSMAMSPDGTRLAYVLQHGNNLQLYLHDLDKQEAVPLAGTLGAFGPFFSFDGRWIGFFAEGKLKKVSVSGGEPIDLCAAANAYGGSWGADGIILVAADEGRRPFKIPETGGIPEAIETDGRGSIRRPDILPSGKAAIVSNPLVGVGVLSLETGAFQLLVPDAGGGAYIQDHLVFSRPGVLLASRFDPDKLALMGPETVVLESVRTESEGIAPQPLAVFSREGTLVYISGGAPKNSTRPVWVDRRGKVEPTGMPARTYRTFNLSPDGRSIAIIIANPRNDVWLYDFEHRTLVQRTFEADVDNVRWTPDGERIVFGSRRNGRGGMSLPREGTGEPTPFVMGSLSPDSKFVAQMRSNPTTGLDLWVHPVAGQRASEPYLRTRFSEAGPEFSPDGRFIAYISDESGGNNVYVRTYPDSGKKWKISSGGGEHVVWSSTGKELFYRNGQKWMSAAVSLKPEFKAEPARLLFEGPYALVGNKSYDVTSDGQRFLVLEPVEQQLAPVTHLNVVLNWLEEVKRRTAPASIATP